MSNLPEGWELVQLKDIVKFRNGKGHEQHIDNNGKYIVVNSKFISTNGEIKKYSNENLSPLMKGDITLVMSDIPNGRALAKCFLINEDNRYTLNQRICSLQPKKDNNKFLCYKLNRNKYFMKFNDGVSQTNLRKNEVLECPIELPPLSEQKKIAEILSTVDQKIAFVDNQIEETELLKKGLMQKLLTEGIGHSEFKDSELGLIPVGWEVVELLKVCEDNKHAIVDGPFGSNLKTIHFREEGIPVIQSNFVTSGKFNVKEYVYVDEDKFNSEIRSKVVGGDIVMAKIGANCGTSAIVPLEHPVSILSGNSIKISIDRNKASTIFVDFIFKSKYSKNKLVELKSVGAQPAISMPLLKKMKIVKPPLEEQKKIAKILSTTDEKLENLKAKKESFEELKKGLMQKLLTGEVRV